MEVKVPPQFLISLKEKINLLTQETGELGA
jgi:hypothetical protein